MSLLIVVRTADNHMISLNCSNGKKEYVAHFMDVDSYLDTV